MRKAFIFSCIMILAVFLTVGVSSCTKEKEKDPTDKPVVDVSKLPDNPDAGPTGKEPEPVKDPAVTPTDGATVKVGGTEEPFDPGLPYETVWKITLERLELIRDLYKNMAEIYEKNGGSTPEAEAAIKELQKKQKDDMQAIFAKYDITGKDFFPRGPDKRKIFTERQQYLKDNPEMNEKYQTVYRELSEYRKVVREYKPKRERPTPPGRRPQDGNTIPPAPPAPPNPN